MSLAEIAQQVREQYNTEHGLIRDPGKFEGEPIYVPYFWRMALEGAADDEGCTLKIPIDKQDRKLFPELAKKQRVIRLYEDDQGFVRESARPIRSCRV